MIKKMSVLAGLSLVILAGCGYEEFRESPGEISDSTEQMVELSIVGTIGGRAAAAEPGTGRGQQLPAFRGAVDLTLTRVQRRGANR